MKKRTERYVIDMNGRAPLWYALELELLKNPWRFLLQLLCHFMIGWIVFQLIITIITGMFLLGILLFYPEAFFLPVVTPEKLNHFSFELWSFFKLCIWRYGVIAGFLFMLGYTITKGLKLARCLKR